jgi:DNA-binding response OmpR family regulator
MSGTIGFESILGNGTTFFVDFPCCTTADDTLADTHPGLHNPRTQNKPVILHVEDDPDICQVLLTLVGDSGTILSTHTLSAAKVALLSKHIDLVILDLGLPDGEGRELLALIKRQQLHVPVIIFSALELNVRIDGNVKAALVKSRTSNEQLLAQIKQII